jgi:hypothetical protein
MVVPVSVPNGTEAPAQRKYALIKVSRGDYLLPSNDGLTLWRIAQYTEGPSTGLYDWPTDRQVWGAWKWEGRMPPGEFEDPVAWDQWSLWSGMCESRAEAIREALRLG